MPAHPYDDETLLEAVRLKKEYGTTQAAADSVGISRPTMQHRLRTAAARGLMLDHAPAMPGFRISRVSDGPRGRTIEQKPDTGADFAVPHGHAVKGISALLDADGREIVKWVKTDIDKKQALEWMHVAVDELKMELPKIAPTKGPEHVATSLLNQYTVTDLHFGMLAWAEETGDADYDLKIAEKMLIDWFAAAIGMSPRGEVAVLAQLGDLMHHDALESVTPTHKHVLDADSRLQKVIRVVIRVIRCVIAMLLDSHPRVHVIMASANHDPASSAWLREMLHAMYEDEPRITIDNSPDVYYVYEWGKTALFYHHGHKRKIANVDTVFAGKFREIYGRCPKAYGHIGHLHNDESRDSNLMKVERHRTLAPSDAYASGGGWLSERDAKVITYHKQFGEVSRITLSPQMVAA
jgi:hypothetical protein